MFAIRLRFITTILPAVALIVWITLVALPFLSMGHISERQAARASGSTMLMQMAGFVAFVGLVVLARRREVWNSPFVRMATYPALMFAVFFLAAVLGGLAVDDPARRVAYAVATWIAFVAASAFWASPPRDLRLGLTASGLVLFAICTALLVLFDVTAQRNVGGVQPNQFGQLAFAAAVLCTFGGRRLALAGMVLALVMIATVASRSALLALLLYAATYFVLGRSYRSATLVAAMGLLAFIGAELREQASDVTGRTLSVRVGAAVDLLSEERGIGSGFTGRTEHWSDAAAAIAERPILGWGFRQSEVMAHSGYLQAIVDMGVLFGTLLIVTCIVVTGRRLVSVWTTARRHGGLLRHEQRRIATSYLVAIIGLWVFEPLYINIGAVTSIVLILMLAQPPYRVLTFGRRTDPPVIPVTPAPRPRPVLLPAPDCAIRSSDPAPAQAFPIASAAFAQSRSRDGGTTSGTLGRWPVAGGSRPADGAADDLAERHLPHNVALTRLRWGRGAVWAKSPMDRHEETCDQARDDAA